MAAAPTSARTAVWGQLGRRLGDPDWGADQVRGGSGEGGGSVAGLLLLLQLPPHMLLLLLLLLPTSGTLKGWWVVLSSSAGVLSCVVCVWRHSREHPAHSCGVAQILRSGFFTHTHTHTHTRTHTGHTHAHTCSCGTTCHATLCSLNMPPGSREDWLSGRGLRQGAGWGLAR